MWWQATRPLCPEDLYSGKEQDSASQQVEYGRVISCHQQRSFKRHTLPTIDPPMGGSGDLIFSLRPLP